MPLNLKDSEETKNITNIKKEPILHKPKQDLTTASKIVLWIVAVIVIGGGLYALIKFGIISKKQEPIVERVITQSIDTITTQEPTSQTTNMQEPIPESQNIVKSESSPHKKTTELKEDTKPKETLKEPLKQTSKGQFTIFIGSFTSKEKAEREAKIWNKERNVVSVGEFEVDGNRVFRLCYGIYSSREEAKIEAENMKDKFTNGYWIGKTK